MARLLLPLLLLGWFGALASFVYDFRNPDALAWMHAGLPYYADVLTDVPRNVVALPEVLLLLLSGLGIGDLICATLRFGFRTSALRLASALCFGLICWTFTVMIVASLERLSGTILPTLIVLGLVYTIVRAYQTRTTLRMHATPAAGVGRWSRFVAVVTLVMLAGTLYFALLGALQPEIEFDARLHHLVAAERYVQHGGFYNVGTAEGLPGLDFPQYQEYLYTAAWQLFGMPGAKVMSWAGLLVAVIAIVALGAELFGSALVGLLAALLFAGTPVVSWSATTANTDLAQVPLFLLALYGVLRWKERAEFRNWLVFAGLLCGYAFGIKLFSAASCFILAILIAAIAFRARRGLTDIAYFGAVALAVALPSLVREALLTGDPVFPIAANLFHSPLWSHKADDVVRASYLMYGQNRSWFAFLAYPWLLTMRVGEYRNIIGPQYLFALPFTAFYAFRKDAQPLFRTLLALAAAWVVLWYLAGAIEARYAMSLFPLATLMTAYIALSPHALAFLGVTGQRVFIALLLVTTVLNSQPLVAFQRYALQPQVEGLVRYQWAYLYGNEPQDDVQLRYVPTLAWMNAHFNPHRDRVYTATMDDLYNLYSDVELYAAEPLPWHQALTDWTLESPEAYDRLKALGVDYVLVTGSEATQIKNAPLFSHLTEAYRGASPDPNNSDVLYRLSAACASRPCSAPVTARIAPPGFYRHSDNPTVYRIQSSGAACVVLTMEQMQAFGGFAQVKVVAPSVDFLAGVKQPVPACVTPAHGG